MAHEVAASNSQNTNVRDSIPAQTPVDLDTTSVVFFDGVCNLCNRIVDFLIRRDKKHVLRYAQLQGTSAAALLDAKMVSDLPSVAFLDKTGAYQRSNAVLRAAAKLGGIWSLAKWLLIIPRPIRDAVYDWIARNRYKWFGKRDSCRLPTPEERSMFLD
jgi:predicted DCC family thiol-disulfide oxidoreductase YuxK